MARATAVPRQADITFSPFFYMQLRNIMRRVVEDKVKPIGICAMSEKQGGQHEVGLGPVQAAASFYATMTVDGQNRDLVNIWRGLDVAGGDQLIIRLDFDEDETDLGARSRQYSYTVNHYYKGYESRAIDLHAAGAARRVDARACGRQNDDEWAAAADQLCPCVEARAGGDFDVRRRLV